MRDASDLPPQANFLKPSWVGFLALCFMAAFLTFTGVYDAVKGLAFWWGWAYWMLTLVVGCLVGYITIVLMHRLGVHRWLQYGLALILSSIAVTSVILGLQFFIGQPVPLAYYFQLFSQVFVISIAIFSIGFIYERAASQKEFDKTLRDPVRHFLENLPVKYRDAELYAIASEDHYLRVYTDKGEELILMRLTDAVHNLKDANGLQTHRSWWVAEAGLAEVNKENGQTKLILKSGVAAPVSRTYQSAVKAAGWFYSAILSV